MKYEIVERWQLIFLLFLFLYRCGKLVVSTNQTQDDILQSIFHQSIKNGVNDVKIYEMNQNMKKQGFCVFGYHF